jgi:hypothetical protein
MSRRFRNYPVIFTHIPRSGGTTLARILEKQYSRGEQFFFYVRQKGGNTDEALAEFAGLSCERRRRLKLLFGHTSFGIHEGYEHYTYITLLRDPVERAISYYYYVITQPGHYLHDMVLRDRMRLEDFVASGMSTELDNIQTRQISGVKDIRYGKCSVKILESAKLNLVRQYAICGITERFDESVILMKRLLGWDYPFYLKRNVISAKPSMAEVPESTVRTIKRINHLDTQLYQFALAKFQATIDEQDGSFRRELEVFRKYNGVLGRHDLGKSALFFWNQYVTLRRSITRDTTRRR